MSTRRPRPSLFVAAVVIALGAAGCAGTKPLLSLTSAFAKVTDKAAGALAAAPRLGADLCRRDAEVTRMRLRVENLDDGWGSKTPWSGFSDAPRPEVGGGTWRQHCERMAAADQAFAAALEAMADYAGSLSAVSEHGGSAGVDLTGLTKSAATAVTTLGGAHAPNLADAAGGVGGAISGLANLLIADYTVGRLRELLGRAAPLFHTLLSALERLLAAQQEQHGVVRQKLGHVLDKLDVQMKQHAANPAQVVAFFDFSRRELDQLARVKEALDRCTDLLAQLLAAHRALAAAAAHVDDRKAEKQELQHVGAALRLAITHLEALQQLTQREGGVR